MQIIQVTLRKIRKKVKLEKRHTHCFMYSVIESYAVASKAVLIYLNEQSDAVKFFKESCFGQLGVITENL